MYVHTCMNEHTHTQTAEEAKRRASSHIIWHVDGKAIFNQEEQYVVRLSRVQSLDGLTCCLYVASLDYLAPRDSDTIVSSVQGLKGSSRAPSLCSSALHSRSLSLVDALVSQQSRHRLMHALSESPGITHPESFVCTCMHGIDL